MRQLEKASILTELMTALKANGSWCGETHIQKAIYLLQEVLGVETDFEYILYKHGPYSFDLAEELSSLRADYLMEFDYRSPGYGPTLVPTKNSEDLRSRFPKTITTHKPKIEFIAKKFGKKGVAELEKLATALWVTRELKDNPNDDARAERIHALKPHVSFADALQAVREFDQLVTEAESVKLNNCHAVEQMNN